MSELRLKGKVAVVTGAATGIGRAIALQFAKEGAKVVLSDAEDAPGSQLAEEIKESGLNATFIRTDISDQEQVKDMIATAKFEWGDIDILVNNPKTPISQTFFRDLNEDDWNELMEYDALGSMYAMWEVLPSMRERKSGSVINITSLFGTKPDIRMAFYGYFKAGMNMFTKCLSVEYAPHNVRINAVAPGIITAGEKDAFVQDLMGPDSMTRAAKPEEVAEAVTWLASDAASYVAGAVIPVDGGVVSTMRNLETWEAVSAN